MVDLERGSSLLNPVKKGRKKETGTLGGPHGKKKRNLKGGW